MDENILAEVRKLVAQELSVEESEVTPQASFADDLGADSLAQVELIMAFEEKFNIDNIPDEEADKIRTVKNAVEYIEKRLAERGNEEIVH